MLHVIAGLGNPGREYEGTRHNIGFAVMDYLASAPAFLPFKQGFHGLVAEGVNAGGRLLLLKPQTYMNLSGRSVRAIVDFYKLPLERLLVVCDDFNLPLGKLRVRPSGGHGGQKGLRNIQEVLGTDAYARLRVGVGQPPPGEAVDFVLSRFRPGEQEAVEQAIARAAAACLTWATDGIAACMNAVNGPERARPARPPRPKQAQPTVAPRPADEAGSPGETSPHDPQ